MCVEGSKAPKLLSFFQGLVQRLRLISFLLNSLFHSLAAVWVSIKIKTEGSEKVEKGAKANKKL